MKKAFTLIELLVVIAIIAILASILLTTGSSGIESARAVRCLTNLKSLGNAFRANSRKNYEYPLAGSRNQFNVLSAKFTEKKGWISWNSKGFYPAETPQNPDSIRMCSANEEERIYALTNGAFWARVGYNREVYRCPTHLKVKGEAPIWSYVMNSRFGWQSKDGVEHLGIICGKSTHTDRILLFAEVPFAGPPGSGYPTGLEAGERSDAILQYAQEHIGFNHKSGKGYCAHVAFADGHCEKIFAPKNLKKNNLLELTEWLCTGVDVNFDGQKFQKIDK